MNIRPHSHTKYLTLNKGLILASSSRFIKEEGLRLYKEATNIDNQIF